MLIEPQIRYYTLSNFTTNLYACSEDLGGKGSKERIENIQITSEHDFDEAHVAGSSLNDLFLINYPNSKEDSELTLFLQIPRKAFPGDFILRLKKKPGKSLLHQFTVKYSHIGGETFEGKTKSIKLL